MAGVEQIDILKLDIEGAEKELLQSGSDKWMHRVAMIIIELHDWLKPGCADALNQATAGMGFTRFQLGENTVLVRT